jgi:tRNA uridine 5-carboxymethylaminomethyl modification enzyme
MTYTSLDVHDIFERGFDRSPMFNGRIKRYGIREINKSFADKERHNCLSNLRMEYLRGICKWFSTSLPEDATV